MSETTPPAFQINTSADDTFLYNFGTTCKISPEICWNRFHLSYDDLHMSALNT
jgi:hypothetical protein